MNIELIFNNDSVVIEDITYNLGDIFLLVENDTKYLSIKSILQTTEFDKKDVEGYWINRILRIVKIEDNKVKLISDAISISPIIEDLNIYKWLGLEIKTFSSEREATEYQKSFDCLM